MHKLWNIQTVENWQTLCRNVELNTIIDVNLVKSTQIDDIQL